MNYEGPYFVKGSLHKLCPCFDIVFAQTGVIPRTRNRFIEIVAVAKCYLIMTHAKNTESKKQPFRICLPVKLADERMTIKKETFLRIQFIISPVQATWLEKQNLFRRDKLNMNL